MKNLPAFLRTPSNFKLGSLDDAAQGYQSLLGVWLIEMALYMKWYRKPRPHRLPDFFDDDAFLAVTGINPPLKKDDDGDLVLDTKISEASILRLLKTRLETLRRWPRPR